MTNFKNVLFVAILELYLYFVLISCCVHERDRVWYIDGTMFIFTGMHGSGLRVGPPPAPVSDLRGPGLSSSVPRVHR